MSSPHPTQLDIAFTYHQAVISTVRCALRQSHGVDFAAGFVDEHRDAILVAALWRVCGYNARVAAGETSTSALARERL
jgi:hypothetical protein